MIFSETSFFILIIVVAIVLGLLVAFGMWKLKFNKPGELLTGFVVVGMGVWLLAIMQFRAVYVVDGRRNFHLYHTRGATELELDGKKVPVDVKKGECLIVNFSDAPIKLQRISYTNISLFGSAPSITEIGPGETYTLDQPKIDYEPGEQPPMEVEVDAAQLSAVRYQLIVKPGADTMNVQEQVIEKAE